MGRAFCGRCEAPTAFEVFGCDEYRNKDFAFDGTQAPLRYEGVGEELVRALNRRGYLRAVYGQRGGGEDRGARFG
jgi:predicted amidophosphoribosyltransferase